MKAPASREAIEWLARLVAHDTSAGNTNLRLIEDVRRYLEGHGARTETIAGPRANTANLLAQLGPTAGKPIVLSAHTDVVPAEPTAWTTSPFTLARRDGLLYGRGTTDMKGFIAAVLAGLPHVVGTLRRPLYVALSADEELGVLGVWPMLARIAAAPVPPAFTVVGECTMMEVAVAHKGKLAARVTVEGVAAHAAIGSRGLSAVRAAANIVLRLYALETDFGQQRDTRFAVPHLTVNVGRVEGGTAINMVADHCTIDLEVRTLPSQSPDDLLNRIEGVCREAAGTTPVTVEALSRYPGLDEGGAIPGLVARLAGASHEDLAMNYGAEAGAYREIIGAPVVLCGPGNVTQAHTVNEFLEEEQLARAEKFVRRLGLWMSEPG